MKLKEIVMKIFAIDTDIQFINKEINSLKQNNKTLTQEIAYKENQILKLKEDYKATIIEFDRLKKEIYTISEENANILLDNNSLLSDIKKLELTIFELNKKLETPTVIMEEIELKLTNKYPKQIITYDRKELDGDYNIDVRNFIALYKDDKIPIVNGKDFDEIALNACLWVQKNITYKYDNAEDSYKKGEYWAYPYQTLKHKYGDCEDGAILMACIMLKSGIPYYRVRLGVGSVNGGGHAYVCYARLKDDSFTVLDWCYWPNEKHPSQRPLHKDEQNYSNVNRNYYVWFSFDLKNAYGQMLTINAHQNEINGKFKFE